MDDLVWNNIKELLMQPDLLVDQAKKWLNKVSPLDEQIELIKSRLKVVDEKYRRYKKMFGDGDMDEPEYINHRCNIDDQRSALLSELRGIEDEQASYTTLPLEQLLSGVVKLVEELDVESKDSIIQKIVTKIIATKEEVTVCGKIPVLSDGQIGLNVKYRHRRPAKRRQINVI